MPNFVVPTLSRALVRNLLLAFVVLDLVALAAFSVRVNTTTRTTSSPVTLPVTPGTSLAPITPVPVDPGIPAGAGGVPIADLPASTSKPAASKPSPADPDTPKPDSPAPAAESGTPLPEGSARVAPCPVHVADTRTDGGLQSLISFAPAFGPFSAEAFAMASAYQPVLQLIGPILAKYPALAPSIEPLLDPLLGAWQQLLDQGFAILGPLYSPYRTSVLEAETKLAAALAPYAQQLASTPLGGCVIELQNALLHDAPAVS